MPPHLRLFGTPALVMDDAPVRLAVPGKALALLGLVAAQPGCAVERAVLAAALHPDQPDAQARTDTRRHLHLLTKALPAGAFVLTKNTVQLSDALSTDVAQFLREDGAAAAALRTGEYCAGVFEDALEPVRAMLDRRYTAMLMHLLAQAEERSDGIEIVRRLEQLTALDPLDEALVRRLMAVRHAHGDRTGALRDYNALAQRLRAELDAEPERQTAALFQSILFATDASDAPHNLRAASTSFVGRERELDTLSALLRTSRLISITGSPGIGKTRLARHAAFNHLDHFPGGVWFVDLAASGTAAELHEQVLSALPARRASIREGMVPAICSALREKRVLLILDNCEHLLDAVRTLVQALLSESSCAMLLTSRRRLSIPAEQVIVLEPLDCPLSPQTRASDVKRSAAARLFAERAIAVAPSLRINDSNAPAIAALVRKIDGIPLAIEIVAARANLLTVDGMLKRFLESMPSGPLRASDTRYTSVDAAIAWSYDLLSAAERRIFESLAVFAGGWTPDAAERVCEGLAPDVFSAVSELVESSLLRVESTGDDVRYFMFEMTRAFALEKFEASSGAGDLQRRHAEYYAALAEELAAHFKSEREVEFYRKCDREYANFRAAMTWSLTHDVLLSARLAGALWRYAVFSWRMTDMDALIAHTFENERDVPAGMLARVHLAAGMFAKERMEGEKSAHHLRRALETFRASADGQGEIDAIFALSLVTFNHGDVREAQKLCEECLTLQQAANDVAGAAATTANLGAVAQMLDDDVRAVEFFQRALSGFLATNNERGVAYAYRALALSYETLGRLDEAVAAAQQSVALYERLGEQSRLADGLVMLGNVLANVGRLQESLDAFIRAFDALSSASHSLFTAIALLGYANTAQLLGDHVEAVRALSRGRALAEATELKLEAKYSAFVDGVAERAKDALGEQQFDAAWMAGRWAELPGFARNAASLREKVTP